MSDLGLLSQQYHELVGLARQVREWAIQVKRASYEIAPPQGDAMQASLDTSLSELARVMRFLRDVIALEDEGAWPEQWLANPPLPTFLVERLRAEHALDLPRYQNQLARLTEHLERGVRELTETDLETLDSVVLAVNADVNAVFRRMLRWA